MALLLGLKGLTEWKVCSLIEKCNKLSQSVFCSNPGRNPIQDPTGSCKFTQDPTQDPKWHHVWDPTQDPVKSFRILLKIV